MSANREEELKRIKEWIDERRKREGSNTGCTDNDPIKEEAPPKTEESAGQTFPENFLYWPERIKKHWLQEIKLQKQFPKDDRQGLQVKRYLEWFEKVPWKSEPVKNISIINAKRVLDEEHYGMEDVKQIILEVLAVQKLKEEHSGTVLLFSGPPGVGKTSLAKSIAHALERSFGKISMGGMTDEISLKGADRAYMNAFPGSVMRTLCKCGSSAPVILLDEIDKIPTESTKGDCSSILLDILDSNREAFTDNYLQVPFDLSEVFFICTANDESKIPKPLMDRMEVIRLRGYTFDEKFEIVKRHIVPRKLNESGLEQFGYSFSDEAIKELVQTCASSKGVRKLEKLVTAVCRRVALLHLSNLIDSKLITKDFIEDQSFTSNNNLRKEKRIGFYIEDSQ